MASFQELEKGKYKLTVELGYRGKRRIRRTKTVYARNKTEARKLLVLFEAELSSKKIIDSKEITLEEFYPKWKENHAKSHYGVRTYEETCRIIVNRIMPEFGTVKLKDIEKLDVVLFLTELQENGKRLDGKEGKLSSSTIHNIYKAFNGLMSVAEDWDLIEEDSNPCSKVKLPKIQHEKGQVYSMAETEVLFDKLESVPLSWQLIVQVAAVAGAREGEIAALEAKHLDAVNNVITIEQALVTIAEEGLILKKTKSDRTRKVSVPADLMKALMKLKLIKQSNLLQVRDLREWKGHTFLFSNDFGKPLRPDSIAQWWSRFMIKNNKLKKIRFHDLRHTSATLLISKGVNAKIIQERLGHSNISTTMNTYVQDRK